MYRETEDGNGGRVEQKKEESETRRKSDGRREGSREKGMNRGTGGREKGKVWG